MRRWFLLLSLLGCLNAHAAAPVWAIRGAHNTVYLAGSVHLLKAGDAALPAAFDQAYAKASTLVMEVDIDAVDPTELQSLMLDSGHNGTHATLRATLGEARYARVSAEAARLGLPLAAIEQFQPWAIALTLAELEYTSLGFDPEQGVEKQLEERAHSDGKRIQGLETVADQLGVLSGMSLENQARFLDQTVTEAKDTASETDELVTAWRRGDAAKLSTVLSAEYRTFPSLYQALVTDRNKRWVPQIEHMLADDHDYLIVVGALHLVGDGGLLELLGNQGFKASQLQ